MNPDEGLRRARTWLRDNVPMVGLSLVVVAWALSLHRNGHTWGDDFTLYLRQAKSLVDGNVGQVIADNHFNVDNAAKPGFSPYVYPWSFPMLLAPLYRLFGLDFARLKLIEVASFVVFLWCFFAAVRRRIEYWAAFGVVASVGTTLIYLQHTDQILSELPYMAAVAITLWYLDRLRDDRPLHAATRAQLITLGVLAMIVFNMRREGLAIVLAIAVAQALDLRGRWRGVDQRQVLWPYVSFIGSVILLQLMLPSALAPEYDDAGLHQTWLKLGGPFRRAFAQQLGFDNLSGMLLLAVFLIAVVGATIRMVRAPSQDAPLLVFAVVSMTIVGMIPAMADRYLMAITPFAVYFGAQALAAVPLPRNSGHLLAAGVLGVVTFAHLTEIPSTVQAAQEFNQQGVPVDGPESAYAQHAFDAVRKYTQQDDVVAFLKVRALTLYTNRRGVQSDDLEVIRQRANYFLMLKNSNQGQPQVTNKEALDMGWEAVWQDARWVLWRLPLYGSP